MRNARSATPVRREPGAVAALALAALLLGSGSRADFTDDFESHAPGDLAGQGGWETGDDHLGGAIDVSTSAPLTGVKSAAVNAVAFTTCSYRHVFAEATNGGTASWSWLVSPDLDSGRASLSLADYDDSWSALTVEQDMFGDVFIVDGFGYQYATWITPGVKHTFQVVVSATSSYELYIDGAVLPAWSGWLAMTGVDRVVLECTAGANGGTLSTWDDISLVESPPPPVIPGLETEDLTTLTPADLVNCLLGSGVTVSNISYTGDPTAAGKFTGGESIIGFESGIVLSAGMVEDVKGPNTADGTSSAFELPGDSMLDAIVAPDSTNDAAVLSFDFTPCGTVVSFDYVFASEEYNEFVYSFNDVFAFFVNGTNAALLPGTSIAVSINTVNGGNPYGIGASHPELFRNNDPSDGIPTINTEMDGLTVVLTVVAPVVSGAVNTIRMAIADTRDDALDSAVFIRAGSFSTKPALEIQKRGPPAVFQGDTLTYEIVVISTASTTTQNIVVWDTVPAGSTFVTSSSGGVFDGSKVVWDLGELGPSASVYLSLSVSVEGTSLGSNVAISNYQGCVGSDRPNVVSGPVTVLVLKGIPVLGKEVTPPGPVSGGASLVYTVSWSNAGLGTVWDLAVTDTLPPGLAFAAGSLEFSAQSDWLGAPSLSSAAWATSAGGAWTAGEPPGGSGSPLVMRWVVDRVAPGASGFVRFRTSVSATLADGDVIANTASATMLDDDGLYPAGVVSTAVFEPALALTKTPSGWRLVPGTQVTFTLGLVNSGHATALAISLWDTLPAGIEFVSASGGGSFDGEHVSWTLPPVNPGCSSTISYTAILTGLADPVGPNSFCADSENPLGMPRPRTCSDEITIRTTGIPVVGKEVSPAGTVCAGGILRYTLSWSNAGAATIVELTIGDSLPNGTVCVSPSLEFWGQTDGAGAPSLVASAWSPSPAGPWTAGEPPSGAGVPVHMKWTVDRVSPGASGFIRFQAGISGTIADGSVVSNAASATQMYDPTVYPTPRVDTPVSRLELRLTKTPSGWVFSPGGLVTYTIDCLNTSADTAISMLLLDTLPAGLTFGSATAGGLFDGTVVRWAMTDLGPGQTHTVQFTAMADGTQPLMGPNRAAAWCSNSASVPQSPSVSPPVTVRLKCPLIGLDKRPDAAPVPVDAVVTYSIAVVNSGDDTAANLRVWDTLPSGFSYMSCAGGASCSYNGTRVLWTIGDLAIGASVYVSFAARAVSAGSFTNTAAGRCASTAGVELPSVTSPPVTLLVAQAQLALDARASRTFTGRCTELDYTVGIRNTGGDTATAISVWDTVPAGTEWRSCSGGGTCGRAGPLAIFTLASLSPGRSATVTFTVSVTGTSIGPSVATASYSSSLGAARPLAVSGSVAIAVGTPQLSVTLWGDPVIAAGGSAVVFTTRVRNTGSDVARDVVVWDSLPAGASLVSTSAGGVAAGSVVTWSVSVLAPGASALLQATLQPDVSCAVTGLDVGASGTARDNCSAAIPYAASPPARVLVANTQVSLAKSASPSLARPGSPVAFLMVWSNTCTDTLWNARIWDTLPAGLSYSGCAGGSGCGAAGSLVTWNLPPLAPGSSGSVTVFTVVSPGVTGEKVGPNRSSLGGRASTGPEILPVSSNEVWVDLLGPRLSLSKIGPSTASVGDQIGFRITVRNTGTETAFGTRVEDLVPSPLAYVSADPVPAIGSSSLVWTIGDLVPGAERVFSVVLAGPVDSRPGPVVNRATASAVDSTLAPVPDAVAEAAVMLTSEFIVYPNPFDPDSAVRGTVKFANAPDGALVRVYTTRGLRVWQGGPSSGFMVEWNGRSSGGLLVAPGLYIWVAELGNWKRRGTLVVR